MHLILVRLARCLIIILKTNQLYRSSCQREALHHDEVFDVTKSDEIDAERNDAHDEETFPSKYRNFLMTTGCHADDAVSVSDVELFGKLNGESDQLAVDGRLLAVQVGRTKHVDARQTAVECPFEI